LSETAARRLCGRRLDLFLGLLVVLGTELVAGALDRLIGDSVLVAEAVLFVTSVI